MILYPLNEEKPGCAQCTRRFYAIELIQILLAGVSSPKGQLRYVRDLMSGPGLESPVPNDTMILYYYRFDL